MRTITEPYRPAPSDHRPLSAYLLASSLMLVIASCVAFVAWGALSTERPATPSQCAALSDGPDRLACYDRMEKEAMRPPARGATAIFRTH